MDKYEFEEVTWDEILKNNKKLDIILSKPQLVKLLDKIGYSTDMDSCIIKKNDGKRVLDVENSKIKIDEFGALKSTPDGGVFVKNDIVSYAFFLAKYS